MKQSFIIMSFLLVSFAALAQQGPEVESYWKNHWKSLQKKEIPPTQVVPVPGDSVRIAQLDNMPVLMPDMKRVEKMPGSHPYTPAPPSKMPNPLYPRQKRGNDF